jgi:hypothetical protein
MIENQNLMVHCQLEYLTSLAKIDVGQGHVMAVRWFHIDETTRICSGEL